MFFYENTGTVENTKCFIYADGPFVITYDLSRFYFCTLNINVSVRKWLPFLVATPTPPTKLYQTVYRTLLNKFTLFRLSLEKKGIICQCGYPPAHFSINRHRFRPQASPRSGEIYTTFRAPVE